MIDDKGNIIFQHDETFPTLAQGFMVKAKRKRLRTLKDIAAYNVAKNTTSESDVKIVEIPRSLHFLGHLFRRLSYSIISYLDVSRLDE